MKSLSLIHTSWLMPFADYFAKRRVSLRLYLDEAKIDARQVTSGEGWIMKHQLYDFLNALAKGERMPELGFVVGETMTPDKLGAISEALSGAGTLGDAIRIFCRLINRSTEENHAWLEEGDEEGELWLFNRTTNPFPADRRIADHAGLMTLINLVRLVPGADWYPRRVTLQTESTPAFRKVPGLRKTDFRFDQPATGLVFPAEWLLESTQSGTLSKAKGAESASHGLLDKNESFVQKLKRLLRELLGVGGMGPTAVLIADLCRMSDRTFQRRLNAAGYSYQELLDETRLDLAKTLLSDGDLPIKEIAFELGYSGANNFIRAFKRMTGMTPMAYREKKT